MVLIATGSNPPVCKILDYGKYKYDALKKDKEIKKSQKIIETKEVRLSMTIDEHDIAYSNKVKISLRMRGREQAYVKKAIEIVNEFCNRLNEVGFTEKAPELLGKNVFVIISPKKSK